MEGFGSDTYILDGAQLSSRFLPFAEFSSQSTQSYYTFKITAWFKSYNL